MENCILSKLLKLESKYISSEALNFFNLKYQLDSELFLINGIISDMKTIPRIVLLYIWKNR